MHEWIHFNSKIIEKSREARSIKAWNLEVKEKQEKSRTLSLAAQAAPGLLHQTSTNHHITPLAFTSHHCKTHYATNTPRNATQHHATPH